MKISTTPSVVIRIIIWIILLAGGVLLSLRLDPNLFPQIRPGLSGHLICFLAGVFLGWLAFRAAAAGGRELARRGREGKLPRLETNRLVTTGIYTCTRHPMLFGLTLLPESLALLLGSPSFILIIAPLEALFILLMILTLEEREAIGKFGTAYREYRKRTPLLPRSFRCWKALFGFATIEEERSGKEKEQKAEYS